MSGACEVGHKKVKISTVINDFKPCQHFVGLILNDIFWSQAEITSHSPLQLHTLNLLRS